MGDFKELKVWQRSRELARLVYQLASTLPPREFADFAAQMRASALSIPSNIAEGNGRHSDRDQARCYRIALGSARELEAQLILLNDLGMIAASDSERLNSSLDEVGKMLTGLLRYCARRERERSPSHQVSRRSPRT